MYVCVCLCVCVCIFMYVCVYVYVCMYVCLCVYVYVSVCVYVCVYVCTMYVCVCVCMCMCVCVFVYVFICVYVCRKYTEERREGGDDVSLAKFTYIRLLIDHPPMGDGRNHCCSICRSVVGGCQSFRTCKYIYTCVFRSFRKLKFLCDFLNIILA